MILFLVCHHRCIILVDVVLQAPLRNAHYPKTSEMLPMSKFDLLKQTFLGNLGESIPVSIWKHYPEIDRTPEGLSGEEIAFHKRFNHDLLKVSFHGRYPVVDWGCEVIYDGAISGSTTCERCVVQETSDWEILEPLDVNSGEFGQQVRAIELIQRYAQDKVPTMATVFDPTMVADKLSNRSLTDYMDESPEVLESVLEMITNVMIDFARATLEAGADGLFIATQHSTHASVTDDQYKKFVYPFDSMLISKLRGKAKFMVMHLHAREENERIRFEKIAKTPGIDALNWEDQSADLTLSDGKKQSRKTVMGGIDHNGILRTGTPEEAEEQVLKAVREAGLKQLVIAPGCVVTIDTPMENIQAVVDSIRSINPWAKDWEAYS
ncbi:MAG: uroporphyrinogen decarboxylase family protein [Candidatus Thorarchaeota archaeon]